MGTDYPYPWTTTSVDHILGTPGLSDDERIAILGRDGGEAPRYQGVAPRAERRTLLLAIHSSIRASSTSSGKAPSASTAS
jgi:hypothetical protein